MPEDRKSILLRIPPELWEQIASMAQQELRSTNAQMEFLLREALRARGRKVVEQRPNTESQGPERDSA
jgi:hypothetical protein